jgi:hypothetical protein
MLIGGTIRITPSWISTTLIVDIQWDPATLLTPDPRGPWGGQLALLGGTGDPNNGEWRWILSQPQLELWVPVPNSDGHSRLVAILDQFLMPPIPGATGTGRLAAGLTPTSSPPSFGWEVA